MSKTRYECSWCRELVAVAADRLPPSGACTGQPFHAIHVWVLKHVVLRARLVFESERKFSPASEAPVPEKLLAAAP